MRDVEWRDLPFLHRPAGSRAKRRGYRGGRRFSLEPLEDRHLLAVITVDSTADLVAADGLITLREAVLAANHDAVADAIEATQAGSGSDTIRFAPSLLGDSIVLSEGELLVTDSLAIEGPGASQLTLSRTGTGSVFSISDRETFPSVELSGVRLSGREDWQRGSALVASAHVTMSEMEITGINTGGDSLIRIRDGSLVIDQSVIQDNTSARNLIHFNGHDLSLSRSSVLDNNGGFLIYSDGIVSIEDSTISRNTRASFGSTRGILAYSTGGSVFVSQTTISENDGDALLAYVDNGTLTVSGSTIIENRHGVGFYSNTDSATALVENSIVANGSTDLWGGDPIDVRWSIIGNGAGALPLANPDAQGNIVGDWTNPIDAKLGPLADNGGPTLTHLPLPGSPAIDAGDPAYPLTWPSDQRGLPRIGGTRVDMGAVETADPSASVYIVDTLSDELDADYSERDFSLREAVELANTIPGSATVVFSPELSGGIVKLSLGQITITDSLTVLGRGANQLTVSGESAARIFDVDDGHPDALVDVVISGLTLAGGSAVGNGGAIRSTENLTVTDVEIVAGHATGDGGGIHIEVDENAHVRIANSTLWQNVATSGGGISATIRGGTVAIVNSSISHNLASQDGGGLHTQADAASRLLLEHTTVTSNAADTDGSGGGTGGGIFADHALSLDHAIVAGNEDQSETAPDLWYEGMDGLTVRSSLIGTNVGASLDEGRSENLVGGPITGTIDPRLGPLQDNGGTVRTHALLLDSPAIEAGAESFSALTNDQRGIGFRRYVGLAADMGSYELQDLVLIVDTSRDESDGDFTRWDLSLREAVEISNLRRGKQAIVFDPIFSTLRVILGLGEIHIQDAVEMNPRHLDSQRPFVTVSALGQSRILRIDDGDADAQTNVQIERMQFVEGASAGSGGAILSQEHLSLTNVSFSQNTTSQNGGALALERGIAELHNVVFADNSASGSGGGIHAAGLASLSVRDGRFTGNQADERGGGLALDGGAAEMQETLIEDNSAGDRGGGLFGHFPQTDDSLTITQSYFSNNHAGDAGGGLGVDIAADASFLMENTTIAGNTSDAAGGGVALWMSAGNAEITSSTVSGNTAAGDAGGILVDGASGQLRLGFSTITNNTAAEVGVGGGIVTSLAADIYNSIVAGNMDLVEIAPDIAVKAGGSVAGEFILLGDNRGSGLPEGQPGPFGNIVGGPLGGSIDPLLQPLAQAGGFAPVHLPLPTSPAIDAGDPNVVSPPDADQRGTNRISGGRIDIGATEHVTNLAADFSGDERFDCDDLDLLSAAARSADPPAEFDLTGDANVDFADVLAWLTLAGEEVLGTRQPFFPGDANLDGRVDAQDLGVIGINWQSQHDFGFCVGDFNVDGNVNRLDLNLLAIHWQRRAGEANARVPRAPLANHVDAAFVAAPEELSDIAELEPRLESSPGDRNVELGAGRVASSHFAQRHVRRRLRSSAIHIDSRAHEPQAVDQGRLVDLVLRRW